jgi:uncharacterized membrane protein SpoIIM required for sporulation
MALITSTWKNAFKKYGKTMLVLGIINVALWIIIGLAVRMNVFGLHDFAMKSLEGNFVNDKTTKAMNNSSSFGSFLLLMWHNYSSSIFGIILAIIPLPFFIVQVLENPMSVGFLTGLAPKPFLTFLAGVLPHSITELTMQWLAFSIAIVMFKTEWHNIREEKNPWSGIDWLELLKIALIVLLPLAIVSGLIETYITPQLLNLIK